MGNNVAVISQQLATVEKQLNGFKELEKKYEELKAELLKAMIEHDIKKWETLEGTTITVIPASSTEKWVLSEMKVREEYPEVYEECLYKSKQDRKAYLRITQNEGRHD